MIVIAAFYAFLSDGSWASSYCGAACSAGGSEVMAALRIGRWEELLVQKVAWLPWEHSRNADSCRMVFVEDLGSQIVILVLKETAVLTTMIQTIVAVRAWVRWGHSPGCILLAIQHHHRYNTLQPLSPAFDCHR